jgi:hypothetical protein
LEHQAPDHRGARVPLLYRKGSNVSQSGDSIKPGGKISLANWTPDGFLFNTIGKQAHRPPPARAVRLRVSLPLGAALARRVQDLVRPALEDVRRATVVKGAVALTRDDLVVQAARLFGFDRIGADLKQEIEKQIDALISAKAILDDGHKVRMA